MLTIDRLLARMCLIAVLALSGCAPDPAAPNFLFIVTDDQRFDMLGAVNPLLETPNMDRLASDGVLFRNAFVTTPICAASRASLLTGMVERSHGFTFGTPPLASDLAFQSYPFLLKAAGYHSGFIGKFGVRVEPGMTDSLFHVFQPLAAHPYFREDETGTVRHLTDITTDLAIDYLNEREANEPFALTLSFNAPHADDGEEQQFFWPTAQNDLYAGVDLPTPPLSDPAFFESLPDFLKEPSLNRERWYWRFDTPDKAREMTKGYYRMIAGIDAGIGRVLETLDRLALAENTIIILMGDNGYFLGERGYAGKWLPLEPSIRVPLIILDPRSNGSREDSDAHALNIDLAPTLLDLAGLPIPATMQGRSLQPIVAGQPVDGWRTDLFVEHLFDHPRIPKHEGVRGERFKYARYFEQQPVFEELYDLKTDSMETVNLANDPAYAAELDSLRARTDELVNRYEREAPSPHSSLVDESP